MIDYGHQSIADMVPVAMFIDGISIWLAYYIWSLCPTASGQESSTRYIKLSLDGLIPPEELGIRPDQIQAWRDLMCRCFDGYHASLRIWEELASQNPALVGIPRSLLDDRSDTSLKKVARMKRNYGLDRARYFLPVSAATNVMLLMSARGWVNLCQHLLSHPLPEPQRLGHQMRSELELAAPRMVRYARQALSTQKGIDAEFQKLIAVAKQGWPGCLKPASETCEAPAVPFLSAIPPEGASEQDFTNDLAFHENRYAWLGKTLQRVCVRFGWSAVGFGEIRDLNRHRTGTKHAVHIPVGFYFAADQIHDALDASKSKQSELKQLAAVGHNASALSYQALQSGEATFPYWLLLGTQLPFEHLTTADKFIYEAELRTGAGAHFRYARHLRDVLGLWYAQFPKTKGQILEGSAEPE